MHHRHAPFALAAALVLVLPFFVACGQAEGQAPSSAPPPPTVTVAPVEVLEIAEYAELTGRIEAVESVEVRPRVEGYVEEVRFQAGELVAKGEVLFTIDSRWYRAAFDRTAAELERAVARALTTEREDARGKELLASKAVSAEDADHRALALAEARAARAAAEAEYTSAKLDLEYTEVRAPIAGRVSRALVTTGNYVDKSETLLTTIVSIDPVYAYADVDEGTWLRLHEMPRGGAPSDETAIVEMGLRDEPGFPRRGRIESFDNRIEAMTGSIVLRALFENPDGALIPGLYSRLRIPVSARAPRILVPERAIGTDQGQKFVLVLGPDAKVEYRSVKLGPHHEGKRVVREGLKAGEEIVVNGLQRARPGSVVTPERETSATNDAGGAHANEPR